MMGTIRDAKPGDEAAIFELICELAEYEKLQSEVVGSATELGEHLFGEHPACAALIAETEDGDPMGFALYFTTFSTFLTRPGLHLEDLYVRPSYRGHRIGKALLIRLAQLTEERGYGRLEWAVLDWNKPSIEFYLSLGSAPMDGWTTHRVSGEALRQLASKAV